MHEGGAARNTGPEPRTTPPSPPSAAPRRHRYRWLVTLPVRLALLVTAIFGSIAAAAIVMTALAEHAGPFGLPWWLEAPLAYGIDLAAVCAIGWAVGRLKQDGAVEYGVATGMFYVVFGVLGAIFTGRVDVPAIVVPAGIGLGFAACKVLRHSQTDWAALARTKGLCVRCWYCLAGLEPAGVCPECGHPFDHRTA